MKKFLGILMGLVCLAGVAFAKNSVNFEKGEQYLHQQQFDKALRCFDNDIKKHPNAMAYFYKGECCLQLEKYQDAIVNYQKAIDFGGLLNEAKIRALDMQGILSFLLKDFHNAEIYHKNFIKLYPEKAQQVFFVLTSSLKNQGKYDEALLLSEKISKDDNLLDVYNLKAEILLDMKRYDDCIAIVQYLDERNLDNRKKDFFLASCYYGKGNYGKAEKYVEKEFNSQNVLPEMVCLRAKILLKQNRIGEAIAYANIASKDMIEALITRGDVYAAMGQKEKAIADYKYFLSKSQDVVKNAEVQEKLKKIE